MTCPPTHRTKKEMLKYFCAWLDLIKNFSYKGGTVAVGSAAQIVPILCSTYPPPPPLPARLYTSPILEFPKFSAYTNEGPVIPYSTQFTAPKRQILCFTWESTSKASLLRSCKLSIGFVE